MREVYREYVQEPLPKDPEWERALYRAAKYLSLTERADRAGSYAIGPGGSAIPAWWRQRDCRDYARRMRERWLSLGPDFTPRARGEAMKVVGRWPLEDQERFCEQMEEEAPGVQL